MIQFILSVYQLIPVTTVQAKSSFTINIRLYWSVRWSVRGLNLMVRIPFTSVAIIDILALWKKSTQSLISPYCIMENLKQKELNIMEITQKRMVSLRNLLKNILKNKNHTKAAPKPPYYHLTKNPENNDFCKANLHRVVFTMLVAYLRPCLWLCFSRIKMFNFFYLFSGCKSASGETWLSSLLYFNENAIRIRVTVFRKL